MESNKLPKKVRVRIAPSPTGFLHVGTARTALFNYLFAKKCNGTFILRIEDTDTERFDKAFADDILESLRWLGFAWDEGPEKGGKKGPYRQSERKELYRQYLQKLIDAGLAYFCFCTKEELEAQKQYMLSQDLPPRYSGRCAALKEEDIAQKLKERVPFVIRFRTKARRLSFTDLIKGNIEVDAGLMGDFVIAKNMEEPLFNFAAAIDDVLMEITHVIRGEDHISNTPKQILIQEALGFGSPLYAHLPLILGPDKSKLSKRHGAASIREYREAGYLSHALINFIAFLGWNPGGTKELFSLAELVEEFDLAKVHKANAVFNLQKLDWFNAHYIRQETPQELARLCMRYLPHADTERLEKVLRIERDRLKKLSDIAKTTSFFFEKPEYAPELLLWKQSTKERMRESLSRIASALSALPFDQFAAPLIKQALDPIASALSNGEVYWPLRVALSGKEASPGPLDIAEIIGKEETVARIRHAITKCAS